MARTTKTTRRGAASASAETVKDAVYYVRVSSAEQEQGFSLDAQVRAAREYATAQGLRLVKEFADVESAKRAGRAQFTAMLTYLKKHKSCQAVIVEKTDRLYRNLKDWVEVDELMQTADLSVHLYKEGTVLTRESRSHEKFIHGIKVLMAKNFIDNLSEEVRKGMTEKARQGFFPGLAPVGYVNNPATKMLDVDPTRAPLVKHLFELYASGEYSIMDIRKVARDMGLTSHAGKNQPLGKSGINRMLNNAIYAGTVVWRERSYPGKHQPLISQALFDRVQAILHGRQSGIYQERQFAFTGLLRCGHCGCALTAEIKKGKYIYYRCTGNKGRCPEKYLREERVDEQLAQILAALQLDERVFASLRIALKESHADEKAHVKQVMTSLQAQETKLTVRLQNLYTDKLDGLLTTETYLQLKGKMEAELDQVRGHIAANQRADRRYMEEGVRLLELAQTAYESYSRRSPAEKRKLLNFVVSNCVLKDGTLTPTYRQPFDWLAPAASMIKKRKAPDITDRELFELRGG